MGEIKMNEVSEIILHVGLHKTGTSSIQETLFLNENNKILKNHGFLYPKNWVPNHSIPVYSAFCDNPEKYHANIKLGYNLSEIEEKIKSGEVYKSAFLKVNDKIKNIFKNEKIKLSQVFGEKSINIFSFEDVIKHE